MKYSAPLTYLLAASTFACTAVAPDEPDPLVELQPLTFQTCGELEAYLDTGLERPPAYARFHNAAPPKELGFEDVAGFEQMVSDGDFVYIASGTRLGIFVEREQQARAVGAVEVGDPLLGDQIIGVHVDGFQAVVLVGMSQESAVLRDSVLPSRPIDAAILRAMVFDVSDPRSPTLQRSIFIDGGYERAWASDGKVTIVARTGLHTPSPSEGRGRNLPASYPYLYDLNVESGDAWVHQDDPVAYCTNAVGSNVGGSTAQMLVSFDLDDEEPGLSSSLFLESAPLLHATRDAAVFLRSSAPPGRIAGTYVYRFATDGERPRFANWSQVTGLAAGDAPADERDGVLRVGTGDSFWNLALPDGPGPLEPTEIALDLLPREEVQQWRFRGAEALGQSIEWEDNRAEAHRYLIWRLDTAAQSKRSLGPDLPPEQEPIAFDFTDADELYYVSMEVETERNDQNEEVPVTEHFRGRVVDLTTTPASRVGAFQYIADVGVGSNFSGPVEKFSDRLYGFKIPRFGQMTFHTLTDEGVLIPAQNVDHIGPDGLPVPVRDTLLFGATIWTMSDVALALVDGETVGVTHYYDL